jgi:hypothetical protein
MIANQITDKKQKWRIPLCLTEMENEEIDCQKCLFGHIAFECLQTILECSQGGIKNIFSNAACCRKRSYPCSENLVLQAQCFLEKLLTQLGASAALLAYDKILIIIFCELSPNFVNCVFFVLKFSKEWTHLY